MIMDIRREIELRKKLEAISSKAAREPPPPEDRFNDAVMDSSTNLRELALKAQVAKISTNAIKEKLGWKPSKIRSDVTEEMIRDYQQKMNEPIELEDEFGVKQKYLYHPSSVDIDLEEYVPPRPDAATEAGVRNAEGVLRRLVGEINQSKQVIKTTQTAKQELDDLYEKDIGQIDLELASVDRRDIQKIRRLNLQRQQRENDYLRELEYINRVRERELRMIADKEFTIGQIQRGISENQGKIDENRAEKKRVDTLNAAKLKAYSDDINLLNRGRMNVQQQPGESDEEFRQRLLDLGQATVDPNAIEAAAEQYNRDKLRERMKELTRDTTMAYTVVNSLSAGDVFAIIQKWSIIKSEFLKVYGFDNRALREADYIEFFQNGIFANPFAQAKAEAEKAGVRPPEAIRRGAAAAATATEEEPSRIATARALGADLTNEQAGAISGVKLAEWIYTEHPEIFANLTGSAKRKKKTMLQKLVDEGFYTPNADLADQYGLTPRAGFARAITSPPLGSSLGSGLKPIVHELPALIEFGKVKISPRKLYYNNTLAIKHKSGASFNGMPNVHVSDKFVAIILNLLGGKKPTLKDFNGLDLNEKGIYDTLIYSAGLGKEVDNTFQDTKQKMKDRLQLIEGEIGAGNSNPALKKELHHLLGKMAYTGMIGFGDAKRYYASIVSK